MLENDEEMAKKDEEMTKQLKKLTKQLNYKQMYEDEWKRCSKLETQLREQYKQNADIFKQLLERQLQVHMRNEEVSKQNKLLNKENLQKVFEEIKREIITKLVEGEEACKKKH